MADIHSKEVDTLFKAILDLGSIDDCYMFFEDVCTIKEIQEIAQRLDVALMLDSGRSYQDISAATGVSAATISRVNKCLNYGSGGYRKAIDSIRGQDS
ncbi:MAG: helix-turn-helix domain-containing protein [Coriobacteriales bacterium]|nr:helix-turn-helix domain-containing protein [Coriobacteriales bacterium]